MNVLTRCLHLNGPLNVCTATLPATNPEEQNHRVTADQQLGAAITDEQCY